MRLTKKEYEGLANWGNLFAELNETAIGATEKEHKKAVEKILMDNVDVFDDVAVLFRIRDKMQSENIKYKDVVNPCDWKDIKKVAKQNGWKCKHIKDINEYEFVKVIKEQEKIVKLVAHWGIGSRQATKTIKGKNRMYDDMKFLNTPNCCYHVLNYLEQVEEAASE